MITSVTMSLKFALLSFQVVSYSIGRVLEWKTGLIPYSAVTACIVNDPVMGCQHLPPGDSDIHAK